MRENGVGLDFSLARFAADNMYPLQKAGNGWLAFCPFHNDTRKPSLYITDKMAYCFSCGKSYKPSLLVAAVKNIGSDQAKEYISGVNVKEKKAKTIRPVSPPSIHAVEVARDMLQRNTVALRYLVEERGVDAVTLYKNKIGLAVPPFGRYRSARITFPAFDETGKLQTISYRMCPGFNYETDKSDNLRYLTHCSTSLLPFNVGAAQGEGDVVYAGGQIDCLTLLSYGIRSVGSMGEGIFKRDWIKYFDKAKVFILLDNDSAGYNGALKMKGMLPGATVVFWPKDAPDKCDINSAANNKNFGIERIIGMLYDVGFSI